MMSGSIRFPFWELNRRPKTGFEVVDEKPQVSVFTATRHPRPVQGNQGRKSFLWSDCREMVVRDDFGVYYQGVTRNAGFETVLW